MGKIEFDLTKLKHLGDIDAGGAIKNFSGYEEYFLALEKFARESKYYLSAYTPGAVMSLEEKRRDFRADLKKIKGELMSLGITYPVATLMELDYEAGGNDMEALTSLMNKFNVEIDKMARCIAVARIMGEEGQPQNADFSKSGEKPLILAVDDKPELLTAVVNMLESRFKVMAATSGKAVLRLIEKHPPELFLLDIEMPEMDGYELAGAIRTQKSFERTPIIFLTGKNTRQDVISAIKRGGNDYLVKPVNKDLLLSKVLHHLGMV